MKNCNIIGICLMHRVTLFRHSSKVVVDSPSCTKELVRFLRCVGRDAELLTTVEVLLIILLARQPARFSAHGIVQHRVEPVGDHGESEGASDRGVVREFDVNKAYGSLKKFCIS